ncbi:hypothetical protein BJ165DRAFT_1448418 [Panaeolus papilionaceus]|nr:hypothetical protein BJ165DRAFT_1448418 [Panaeolus papilionaceus]
MDQVESVQFTSTGNGLNVKNQPFTSNPFANNAKGANGSADSSAALAVSATAAGPIPLRSSTPVERESKYEAHSSDMPLMKVSELSKVNGSLATAQSEAFASFLSQAAWMRLSIVAQPDVTAIAKDPRLKEFVGRVSSLTIQTVSQQIRSELNVAVNRIVDELTMNLEVRVTAVQSVILDEVLAASVNTQATATSDGSLRASGFDSLMTSLNKITSTDITNTINKTSGAANGNGVAIHAGNGVAVDNGEATVENGTVGGKIAVAVTGQTVTSGDGATVSSNNPTAHGQTAASKTANEHTVTGGATQTIQHSTPSANGATAASQWSTSQASNGAVSGDAPIPFDAGRIRGQQFSIDNRSGGGWGGSTTGTAVTVSGNGSQVTPVQQGSLNAGRVSFHASGAFVEQPQSGLGGQWNASNNSATGVTSGNQSPLTSSSFNQSSGRQLGGHIVVDESTFGGAKFSVDQYTGGGWAHN